MKEYCHMEAFNATCPRGKVILMQKALFGRMRVNRCQPIDYEVGCYVEVLLQIDSKCSGKRTCDFMIPDRDLFNVQPCRRDLVSYLEASYTCVPAINLTSSTCSGGHLAVSQAEGYIVSDPGTSNSGTCTVSIHVKVGQRINLTLYDVNRFQRLNNPIPSNRCPVFASVKDRHKVHYIQQEVCSNHHNTRQVEVYTSGSHRLNITVLTGHHAGKKLGVVMLKYQAIGCADIVAPPMTYIHRVKDTLVVTCNNTGQKHEKWHLVCKGNEWVGDFNNCTGGKSKLGVPVGTKHIHRKDEIHVGLLIAIALGVLLGVFSGFIFLLVAFVCRKRYIQNSQQVRTTLLGNPDHQSNMYKMVDVDAPPGEEPCYMCHQEASIYTKSGLEVPLQCGGYTKPNVNISPYRSQDYERPTTAMETSHHSAIDGNIALYDTGNNNRNMDDTGMPDQHQQPCGPGNIRQSQPPADVCLPASVRIYAGHSPSCNANHCHGTYTPYLQPTDDQSMDDNNKNNYSLGQKEGGAGDTIYSFGQNDENSNERVNSFGQKTMMEKYPLPSVSLNAEVKYT